MSDISTGSERVVTEAASDSQSPSERVAETKETSPQFDKSGLLKDLTAERKKRQEYEVKLQELERAKLESEGKKDELLLNYKKELAELKGKVAQGMKSKVEDQLALKAQELGCVDTELLLKTVDLESIEVDSQTLRISNAEAVAQMIEDVRKRKPHLFKQEGARVRDGVPTNQSNAKANDFTKMSKQELLAYAMKSGIR